MKVMTAIMVGAIFHDRSSLCSDMLGLLQQSRGNWKYKPVPSEVKFHGKIAHSAFVLLFVLL